MAHYEVPLEDRIAHRPRHSVRLSASPLRWLRSRLRDLFHFLLGEFPEDLMTC
jgi:hypothetical protein